MLQVVDDPGAPLGFRPIDRRLEPGERATLVGRRVEPGDMRWSVIEEIVTQAGYLAWGGTRGAVVSSAVFVLASTVGLILHYRLPSLGVALPKEAKLIEDYGMRIFRNPGFVRSLTPEERQLRDLPA